ncbi:MAG: glycoside hydrolase N-terminal domain-containing protein, partial [Chloroflexi bacterium]|nr:glycoside hydrolase N-terminal domain-containing protein [Chloroflexota bacterium]
MRSRSGGCSLAGGGEVGVGAPVGVGLGAMVFGGIEEERIQFNEDTLWTGQPHSYAHKGAVRFLPEIRRLLWEGKQREADQLAMREFMSVPLHQKAYQKFGDLLITFLGHEIANGVGPGFAEKEGKKVSIEKILGKYHSSLEEAKADTFGEYNIATYFREVTGTFSEEEVKGSFVTHVADMFRAIRHGTSSAHAKANILQLNYLMDVDENRGNGAIKYDDQTQTFSIDFEKMPKGIKNLARDLLLVEGRGDYDAAK